MESITKKDLMEFGVMIGEKFEEVRSDIKHIREDISDLQEDVSNLQKNVVRIENKVDALDEKVDALDRKIDGVAQEILDASDQRMLKSEAQAAEFSHEIEDMKNRIGVLEKVVVV